MSPPDVEMADPDEDHRASIKRDGPETRTVIIGQERKRQKIQFAVSLEELHLLSLWWMLQRPIRVNWDSLCFYDSMIVDKNEYVNKNHNMIHHSQALFSLPCKTQAVLHVDIQEGHVFRIDEDTQVLTDEYLGDHWHEFEVADESEVRQFAQEKAFTKIHRTKVTDDMVVVDCTWV